MKFSSWILSWSAATGLALFCSSPALALSAWSSCATGTPITLTRLSAPDPLTGSGELLPFHWDVTYDPCTGQILHSAFNLFLFSVLDAGNSYGSCTYPGGPNTGASHCELLEPLGIPCQLPIDPGTYAAHLSDSAGSAMDIEMQVAQTVTSSDVGQVQVTLEKMVFGVWVEIPCVGGGDNIASIDALGGGDYYMKVQIFTPGNDALLCAEIYFSVGSGGTAPIHLIPSAQPLSGLIDEINALPDVSASQKNALIVKLQAALTALKGGHMADACSDLQSFVQLVKAQSGKKLAQSTADTLTCQAMQLRTALACP